MKHKILKRTFLLIMALLAAGEAFSRTEAAQPYSEGDFVVVETAGRGFTKTAAKINARRNAAQKALGFLLEGTSLYSSFVSDGNSHNAFSEKIIRISRAFIDAGGEVISESENARHVFTVTLRLKVSRRELLNGLFQRGPEKSSLDGLSIAASAMAREQWKKETGDVLAEVFGTFPVNDYVRVSAKTAGDFDLRSSRLRVKINMKFDRTRYFSEAVPQLLAVLDYVSEARMADVPFMLPLETLNDGTISITPPNTVRTVRQYLKLMETEDGNRFIRPEGCANIYIQTRDCYFNAYRVNPEAFVKLIETLFAADSRGRLSTKQGYGELQIVFTGEDGRKVDFEPVGLFNMNNIMFFMDRAALTRSVWTASRDSYDEKHHALFILPAFGFEDKDGKNYTLYQEDEGELPPIKVSAEELMSLGNGSILCGVMLKN